MAWRDDKLSDHPLGVSLSLGVVFAGIIVACVACGSSGSNGTGAPAAQPAQQVQDNATTVQTKLGTQLSDVIVNGHECVVAETVNGDGTTSDDTAITCDWSK